MIYNQSVDSWSLENERKIFCNIFQKDFRTSRKYDREIILVENSFYQLVEFTIVFFGNWSRTESVQVHDLTNDIIHEFKMDHRVDNNGVFCSEEVGKITFQKNIIKNQTSTERLVFSSTSLKDFTVEEFRVEYLNCPENSDIILPDKTCSCSEGYFRDPTIIELQCSKCPIFCEKCDGPLQTDCLSCNIERGFVNYSGICVLNNCNIFFYFIKIWMLIL